MDTTVIALDVGEARIGIARANQIAKIAEPLTTISNDHNFSKSLQQIISEHNVSQVVVGLPRGLDGQNTKQTDYVKEFIDQLDIDLPITFQDEAVTSIQAENYLKANRKHYEKGDIDSVSATIILSDYLDSRSKNV